MASILIIEDDRSIAELLRFMVERDGHEVELLADGGAAHLHILTAPAPALVLLDAMLPYRDGLTLLADMRALDNWRAVPVIMLTAKSSSATSFARSKPAPAITCSSHSSRRS